MLRLAVPEDTSDFLEWSRETKNNGYDPAIAISGNTVVLAANSKFGTLAFMPIQRPLMLEAVAVNPKANLLSAARALKELVFGAFGLAKNNSAAEIYCFCSEPATQKMLEKRGFQKMEMPIYRIKMSDVARLYPE